MEQEEYFFEAFTDMKRLGPGSDESTIKASRLYKGEKTALKILDVGCGVGTHTFILAEQFPNAEITAIDNHLPFIEKLNQTAEEKGISDRVKGIEMSMFEMDFNDESFDLIWAEGAIYIIGFQRGLKEWKRFLKPNGYIICSEISWLKENPSTESYNFWNEGYPEINTIDNKLKQIENAGYKAQEFFISPVSDWTANYYEPLQKNLEKMKKKYAKNQTAIEVTNMLQSEIDLYNNNSTDYSYVFYSAVKT